MKLTDFTYVETKYKLLYLVMAIISTIFNFSIRQLRKMYEFLFVLSKIVKELQNFYLFFTTHDG